MDPGQHDEEKIEEEPKAAYIFKNIGANFLHKTPFSSFFFKCDIFLFLT